MGAPHRDAQNGAGNYDTRGDTELWPLTVLSLFMKTGLTSFKSSRIYVNAKSGYKLVQ